MMIETVHFPQISLKAAALTCERGGRTVFSGLDLEVPGSAALLLKGPNGVGKSSLLLALAGLIHFEGAVNWATQGQSFENPAQHIHFSGHRHAIKPELTLAENLDFWADLLGGSKSSIGPALEAAGLDGLEAYAARNLSAGQTHRLALCRLLIAPRPVWLLDEPSSALDADGDTWVAGLIDTHLDQGGLALVATHRTIPLASKQVSSLEMGRGK